MRLVETVARALCREHGGDPDYVTQAKRGTDSQTGIPYIVPSFPQWRRYELDAQTVVALVTEHCASLAEKYETYVGAAQDIAREIRGLGA